LIRRIATLGLGIPSHPQKGARLAAITCRSAATPKPNRGAENAEIGCRIGAKSGAAFRRNHLPLSTEIRCRFAPIFAVNRRVYLCEVTTHLDGLLIGKGTATTINKISDKHKRQRTYAEQYLKYFAPRFKFWSPVVRSGIVNELKKIEGLELFVNGKYKEAIASLSARATKSTSDANNPAFRALQILGHMRDG
jgi:hypothetical protein